MTEPSGCSKGFPLGLTSTSRKCWEQQGAEGQGHPTPSELVRRKKAAANGINRMVHLLSYQRKCCMTVKRHGRAQSCSAMHDGKGHDQAPLWNNVRATLFNWSDRTKPCSASAYQSLPSTNDVAFNKPIIQTKEANKSYEIIFTWLDKNYAPIHRKVHAYTRRQTENPTGYHRTILQSAPAQPGRSNVKCRKEWHFDYIWSFHHTEIRVQTTNLWDLPLLEEYQTLLE